MTENPSDLPNRLDELLKALRELRKSTKAIVDDIKRAYTKKEKDIPLRCSEASFSRYRKQEERDSPEAAELVTLIEDVYQDWFNKEQKILYEPSTNSYIVKGKPSKRGEEGVSNEIEIKSLENLLNHSAITEAVSKGVKTLRILDTWLPYMLHGGDVLLKEWAQKAETIQILILEPASDGLRLRAESLGYEFKTLQMEVLKNLEMILKLADDFRGKCHIEVRLYDSLPTVNLYLVDDIAFYGFFLQNGYSQNHFFNRTEGAATDNYVIKQLAAHFDSIWDKSARDGNKVDKNKVRNLTNQVAEKISTIDKLHTRYWLYYVKERDGKRYLQANILYTNSVSKCKLLYYNARIDSMDDTTGKIKIVGESGNLVFNFTGSSFFLEIHFSPLIAIKPQTIPITLMQIDQRQAKPVASFGFMVKVEDNQELAAFELPLDDQTTLNDPRIPAQVVRALQREFAQTLRHHSTPPAQLQEWPAQHNDQIVERLRSADWRVYFPEHYPEYDTNIENLILKNDVLIAVGTARVRFSLGANGALIVTADTPSGTKLTGEANIVEAGRDYYIHCHLQSDPPRRGILLQMVIRLGRDLKMETARKMVGLYNLVYSDSALGCGFMVAEPWANGQEDACQLFNPLELAQQLPDLDTFLGFRDEGSLLWRPGKKKENYIHEGVYEVFTYGRHRVNGIETKCIIRSVLRIHSNRFVEFKGILPHGEASGKVRMVLNNIFIGLKNSGTADQERRQGFFFFAVKDSQPVKDDLYGGVFSGLCTEQQQPLSKRVIMRYRGKDDKALAIFDSYQSESGRIYIHSNEYNELDDSVREALTGRLTNFIGFQLGGRLVSSGALERYNRDELPLAQMFLDAALYRAAKAKSTKEVEETLQVLRQAFNHGWNDLTSFEEAIQQHEKGAEILRSKIYTDLKKTLKDGISGVSGDS